MLKRLLIGSVLSALVLGGLVWKLPQIVASFGIVAMKNAGLSGAQLEIDKVEIGYVNLGSLSFHYGDALISGKNIRLAWDDLNILNGQAESLTVETLEVELIQTGIVVQEGEPGLAMINSLLSFLAASADTYIPVNDIAINKLLVSEYESGDGIQLHGSLELNSRTGKVELNSVYRVGNKSEFAISVNSSGYDQIVASVDSLVGEELARLTLQHDEGEFLFHGAVNQGVLLLGPARIPRTLIDQLVVSPIIFSGLIKGGVENVDETQALHGSISININNINDIEYTIDNISSYFSFAIEDLNQLTFSLIGSTTIGRFEYGEFGSEDISIEHRIAMHGDSLSLSGLNLSAEKSFVALSNFVVTTNTIRLNQIGNSSSEFIYAQDGFVSRGEVKLALSGLEIEGILSPVDATATLAMIKYPFDNTSGTVAQGSLHIEQLGLETPQFPFVLGSVKQDFIVNDSLLELTGTLTDATGAIQASSEAAYHFITGDMHAALQPDAIDFEQANSVTSLIASYRPSLTLVTGQMTSSIELEWNLKQGGGRRPSVQGNFELNDVGGAYDEYFFSGLSGAYRGSVYPRISSDDRSVITVAHLDAEAAMRDIKAVISLNQLNNEKSGFEIQLFSALASTLGGHAALKPVKINLENTQHELSMLLMGIDIAALLREQAMEDIGASGQLFGEIPITINDNGLSVYGGRIYAAEPGGKIQYKGDISSLSAATGPAGFVFEALQDFNYGSMNIFPEYAPDGTLKMRLEVRGSNPQVEQGRPINLNINLEQNLLKLRESLRYVDGLSDEIDEKVREFYSNRIGG